MTNPLLEGVRVLDLTRLLPGPFCTQYMAQLGAEVIKIEDPDGGDYTRRQMPELFALINRGKKSVTLDLRTDQGVQRFKQLVATADVVVESFRPGVMERLNCGYETLKQINPKLVYASLTGYGHDGPYRDLAGHDINYLAYAGVLEQIGSAGGPPSLSNVQIADLAGGALTCAVGILSALMGVRAGGDGTFLDSAMLDGSLALQPVALATLRTYGHIQPRGKDVLTGALPNYQVYKCRDGKYLSIGALEPKFFARLLSALAELVPLPEALKSLPGSSSSGEGHKPTTKGSGGGSRQRVAEALSDPTQARRWLAPARWALAGVFRLRTRDAWMEALAEADACVAPVLTLEEAMENEQVRARGLIEEADGKPAFACPLRFDGAVRVTSGSSPELGEHTQSVLGALKGTAGRHKSSRRKTGQKSQA